jgi:hypothetical protein
MGQIDVLPERAAVDDPAQNANERLGRGQAVPRLVPVIITMGRINVSMFRGLPRLSGQLKNTYTPLVITIEAIYAPPLPQKHQIGESCHQELRSDPREQAKKNR